MCNPINKTEKYQKTELFRAGFKSVNAEQPVCDIPIAVVFEGQSFPWDCKNKVVLGMREGLKVWVYMGFVS